MLDMIGAIALAYVAYLFYHRLGAILDAITRAAEAWEDASDDGDEDDEGDDDDPDDGERVSKLRAVNG